jgi:hypothetical protein
MNKQALTQQDIDCFMQDIDLTLYNHNKTKYDYYNIAAVDSDCEMETEAKRIEQYAIITKD